MKRITFLVMICLLLVSLSASAQQPLPPPMAPEQVNELMAQARTSGKVRVIVEFAVPAATRSMSERERGDAIKIARLGLLSSVRSGQAQFVANSETWTIPYAALELDAAALQALAATPGVLTIGPDAIEYRMLESALPLIDAEAAHTYGTAYGFNGMTGEGWTVVALDDGIQANHAFFGGRIVHEACFSNNQTDPGIVYTSLCPNGQEQQFGAGSANTNPQCFNDCDHGTHVMGIAIGDDGASRVGVAPGANGIMLNVFSWANDTTVANFDGPTTFVSDQTAALEYVKNTLQFEYKIAAVNMSLGGGQFTAPCDVDPSPAFQARANAINDVIDDGIAVVIASGNDGYKNAVSRPGCINDAITVSAVADNLTVPSFSNVSEQVDFFAPGVSINSSVPAVNGNYAVMQGTSMATPFVAGAWAVLKQAAPNASVSEVRSALQNTGLPVVDNRAGAPGTITRPFIQVHDAMLELANQIYNGHMEFPGQPGLPDGWTGLNVAKRKCNTATKEFTPFGNCTAMLKVTLAGKAQIAQTNLSPDAYPSALLNFSAQIRAKNVLKGMLVLKIYNAAGLITPIKIITTGTSAWTLHEANPFVLSSELTRVKVVVKAVQGGKIFVDNVSAVLTPATTTP